MIHRLVQFRYTGALACFKYKIPMHYSTPRLATIQDTEIEATLNFALTTPHENVAETYLKNALKRLPNNKMIRVGMDAQHAYYVVHDPDLYL